MSKKRVLNKVNKYLFLLRRAEKGNFIEESAFFTSNINYLITNKLNK